MANMEMKRRNKNNRQRGKAFERMVAEYLGFIRVPYSGSSEVFGEGDIRDNIDESQAFYMGECKTITPRSKNEVNFVIKEKWLLGDKSITSRAKRAGNKLPFLAFKKIRSPKWYVVVCSEDFKMMIQAIEILRRTGVISDSRDVDTIRSEIDSRYNEGRG